MSHIITTSNAKIGGRVMKISLFNAMPSITSVAAKRTPTYNKPVTPLIKSRMAEDHGPILQQLGQLQGQVSAMIQNQQQQLKQAADTNITIRLEIEKVNQSITTHKEIVEKRQDRLEIQLEKLKLKVSLIAASISFGATVALQLFFKFWK